MTCADARGVKCCHSLVTVLFLEQHMIARVNVRINSPALLTRSSAGAGCGQVFLVRCSEHLVRSQRILQAVLDNLRSKYTMVGKVECMTWSKNMNFRSLYTLPLPRVDAGTSALAILRNSYDE